MSATDALTRYYYAKEREESAVLYINDAYLEAVDALEKLEAENAKLRELARDMNQWLWNGADCTKCPFTARCDLIAAFESDMHANICVGWNEIHDRMRELGVEVP